MYSSEYLLLGRWWTKGSLTNLHFNLINSSPKSTTPVTSFLLFRPSSSQESKLLNFAPPKAGQALPSAATGAPIMEASKHLTGLCKRTCSSIVVLILLFRLRDYAMYVYIYYIYRDIYIYILYTWPFFLNLRERIVGSKCEKESATMSSARAKIWRWALFHMLNKNWASSEQAPQFLSWTRVAIEISSLILYHVFASNPPSSEWSFDDSVGTEAKLKKLWEKLDMGWHKPYATCPGFSVHTFRHLPAFKLYWHRLSQKL